MHRNCLKRRRNVNINFSSSHPPQSSSLEITTPLSGTAGCFVKKKYKPPVLNLVNIRNSITNHILFAVDHIPLTLNY